MERLLSELLVVSDLVVVDVSEADFVDSSFLRNVLVADRRAKEQDKVFRVQMNTPQSFGERSRSAAFSNS